jgi:peptide/nickel transport system substrate-binding protein
MDRKQAASAARRVDAGGPTPAPGGPRLRERHGVRRRWNVVSAVTGVAVLALIACSCGAGGGSTGNAGGSAASSGTPTRGGTVTEAIVSGSQPSWIWPLIPGGDFSNENILEFDQLLYRPLYMYGNNGPSTLVNYPLSPANPPVYSNGGSTITITLKGWKWSNGETVDAEDVAFWTNMEKAEKNNYGGYTPGGFPDNVASVKVTSPETVVFHLTHPYAANWYTSNNLSEITPMPLAWDVTSLGAKPGSGGCHISVSKCAAVYNFLNAQAKDVSTYASSPLWSVVDGPWRLQSFSAAGNDVFVPNPSYSGSPKPKISKFEYVPYTSTTAVYSALQAHAVDIGAIASTLLPPAAKGKLLPSRNPLGGSYNLYAAPTFSISFELLSLTSPKVGAIFRQLYVRQALQSLVDQPGIDSKVWAGYAYPISGPVPPQPANEFVPPVQKENGGQGPYPFDPAKAKSLLTSHGWAEVGGVMTCERPGSGSGECGAGVAKGAQMSFAMQYASGDPQLKEEAQVEASDAATVGIRYSLQALTFNAIIGESKSTMQLANYGAPSWTYGAPTNLPTGESLYETGSPSNGTGYSNPVMNRRIAAVEKNFTLPVFYKYASYAAEQVPNIWQPDTSNVEAVVSNLHDVGFSPLNTTLPEYFYFSKS